VGESDSNRGIPTSFPEGIKDSKKYISLGQPGISMKITINQMDPPKNPVFLNIEIQTSSNYNCFDTRDEISVFCNQDQNSDEDSNIAGKANKTCDEEGRREARDAVKEDKLDVDGESAGTDDCLVELQEAPFCSVHGDFSVESREIGLKPAVEEDKLKDEGEWACTDDCQVELQKRLVCFDHANSSEEESEPNLQPALVTQVNVFVVI